MRGDYGEVEVVMPYQQVLQSVLIFLTDSGPVNHLLQGMHQQGAFALQFCCGAGIQLLRQRDETNPDGPR